jgi:thiamine biosynthesis protein ThiS
MEIIINGDKRQVSEGYTAADLVGDMQLAGKRIAMEVNREILPRSEYETYAFRDGDQVEVVHAIGGGQDDQLQVHLP